MKSHITVVIHHSTTDIEAELKAQLAPFRYVETEEPSIPQKLYWDYWVFPIHQRPFNDTEIRQQFPQLDAELASHTTYVHKLPKDFSTSGIIDLNGYWTDLTAFGWRMMNKSEAANNKALEQWDRRCQEILQEHQMHICVQVVLHS